VADAAADLNRILALANGQRPDPQGWSLAVDRRWVEASFFGPGAVRLLQTLPCGEVAACAAVRAAESGGLITVTSMLRPDFEHLWSEQLGWIEAQVAGAAPARVGVVSENLTDPETRRWADAGYDLVFEELAMEYRLGDDEPAALWPHGTTLLEWDDAAAGASFAVYEAAFRERPGFPGWSVAEWIEGFTGEPNFLPGASFCAVRDGRPVGFVVSGDGWIGQVGVDPAHRRSGLATALVTEARARMRARGTSVVYLHVNRNNPGGLATWRHLGWRECGRRGRFEGHVSSDVAGTI
jgi:ribosomal protein S18 acetylase RimI-like enzyme